MTKLIGDPPSVVGYIGSLIVIFSGIGLFFWD